MNEGVVIGGGEGKAGRVRWAEGLVVGLREFDGFDFEGVLFLGWEDGRPFGVAFISDCCDFSLEAAWIIR